MKTQIIMHKRDQGKVFQTNFINGPKTTNVIKPDKAVVFQQYRNVKCRSLG